MKKLIIAIILIVAALVWAAGTYTTDNLTANQTVTGEHLYSTDDANIADVLYVDGTMTLSTGSIIDGTGAISFGNENLTTTGIMSATKYALAIGSEIENTGTGFTTFSGDGAVWGGLSIGIPQVAGSHFWYGYGGTEHHYFGEGGNEVEIDDDGNITAEKTVQAEHLYSTDDAEIDDDAIVKGRILVGGVTDPYSLVEEAALQLNRTNHDYIYSASSADWDILNTDNATLTMDFWVRMSPEADSSLCGRYGISKYWFISFNDEYQTTKFNRGIYQPLSFGDLPGTVWTHLAVCKVNGEFGSYKDGDQIDYVESIDYAVGNGALAIGAMGEDYLSNTLGGHVDEFHISFSNTFSAAPQDDDSDTIDVPTSRHTVTDDTKVLLHFDGADGLTTFTDAAGRHTFTDYNTAQLDTGQYKEFGTAGADIVDLSIFSDQNDITLNHVTDSSINVLIEGDLEIQDDLFVQDNLSVDGNIIDVVNITAADTIAGVTGTFSETVQAEHFRSTDDANITDTLTVTTINASGTITGDTLTDGTVTITGGNISGADVDITAGTGAYSSSGTLGAGAITGTSLTDGTLIITDANITSAVNGTFSGTVQGEHLYSLDDANITDTLVVDGTMTLLTGSIKDSGHTLSLFAHDSSAYRGAIVRADSDGEHYTLYPNYNGFYLGDETYPWKRAYIDTMVISGGSITDSSGAISFGTNILILSDTTSDATGIIYKGADRFIHNFHHPTGNTEVPEGQNTFVGVNAGNFAMGSGATETYHASRNNAIGYNALSSDTTGYYNNAIGWGSLSANTTGYSNNAMGNESLRFNTIGNQNTAVGEISGGRLTTGSRNIFIGRGSGYRQTTLSDLLIIDNRPRADIATEATNAIIYGIMAAEPADQTLRINAVLNVTGNTTLGDASTDTTTHTGRMIVRTVTYETNMNTDAAGSTAEIVFCSTDSKFYGCTSGGAAGSATWSALN